MTIGVYMIRNSITGECYVGASQHIETRLTSHRRDLKRGAHINHRLQIDWATYGETAFEFVVLEQLDSMKTLAQRERAHAERLAASGVALYSSLKQAGAGLLPDDTTESQIMVSLAVRLRRGDVELLNAVTKYRYPDDRRKISQTLRDLVREEYARMQASQEAKGA